MPVAPPLSFPLSALVLPRGRRSCYATRPHHSHSPAHARLCVPQDCGTERGLQLPLGIVVLDALGHPRASLHRPWTRLDPMFDVANRVRFGHTGRRVLNPAAVFCARRRARTHTRLASGLTH